MKNSFLKHWVEYCCEAAELGTFMLVCCLTVALVYYPGSPMAGWIKNPTFARFIVSIAMGLTAAALIYSPWGKRSGAHFNPAVTLTFLRLGKIRCFDALFYILFQFIGGLAGVYLSLLILGVPVMANPAVNYCVTVPGTGGAGLAFSAEFLIAFILMCVVLLSSQQEKTAPYIGIICGFLVFCYAFFESPISGFGMNPARTFASALPSGNWTSLWLYFIAPPLGMLAAAELRLRWQGVESIVTGCLHHQCVSRVFQGLSHSADKP